MDNSFVLPPSGILMCGSVLAAEMQQRLQMAVSGAWTPPARFDGMMPMDVGDSDECKPYRMVGGTAMISTTGALCAQDSFMSWLMGGTSYADIRRAFVAAAEDPAVSQILHVIGSGGGEAGRCEETASLIRTVHKDVKPVTTYTGSSMSSAAYWQGAAGGKVYATPTSMVGSIGVRFDFLNVHKAMALSGVEQNTITSGPLKALGDPGLEWTQEAEDYYQTLVVAMNDAFTERMAEYRGIAVSKLRSADMNGRDYIGKQALQARLVDGITTLDQLVSQMQKKKTTSTTARSGMYAAAAEPVFTAESAAAAAAAVQEPVVQLTADNLEQFVNGDAFKAADESPAAPPAPSPAPSPAADPTPAVATLAVFEPSYPDQRELVKDLSLRLAASGESLLEAQVKLRQVEAEMGLVKPMLAKMDSIVAASYNLNQVRMGKSPVDLKGFSSTQLVELYFASETDMAKLLKTGQHARAAEDAGQTTRAEPGSSNVLKLDRSLLGLKSGSQTTHR